MAILLLAASPTGAYGATSVPRGTGQLDSTPGPNYGETLECPGVFPVKITGKLSVYSTKSAIQILNILAGPEHLIIQEKITTATPNTENIVRLATTSFNYKSIGGQYIEDLTALNPIDKPYKGVRNLALNGLPASLFAVNAYTSELNVGTPPPPVDPEDPANYFQVYSSGFTNNIFGFITEYGHALFQDSTQGSLTSVNFSLNPNDNSMTATATDLRAATSNRPAMTVSNLFNGTTVINEQNDCFGVAADSGTSLPSACFALFNMPKNQRTLPGFTTIGSCADLLENIPSTVASATAASTGIKAFAALFWNSSFDPHIPFLAINSSNRLFAGTLHDREQFQPVGSSFFKYKTGNDRTEAYTQPAIGFAGNITTTTIFEGTVPKNLWAAAYPMQPRYHEYLSVNATQYGFILLEKSSKQLQFMLTQHYAQLLPGELQVPAKLVHPPPRSVTWKSAWNMGLGVVPGGSTALTTNTLYRNFANSAAFVADNHIHGGGGHLVALGTFNGILVHNKKVSVWGSNRWGQAVLPSVLQEYQSNPANDFIDVAAAISPPLITWRDGSPKLALDEGELEAVARDYNEAFFNINDLNSVYSYGAYPAGYGGTPTRYTGHINYYNLPGHVAIVTSNGRVYCWGNDLYNQCKVPDDIALVDSAGNIRTAVPTDPVEEIACGAFHTVARTKGGAVYVWGAGSPAISPTGYVVVQSGGSPLRDQDSSANYMVSRSVHFGQACFNGDPQSGILYNPIVDPRGLSNDTEFAYVQNTAYSAANIITVQDVNGIVVGQKTVAGFSVTTPTGKRLKGMIAAGAFHTAIIDNKFKLQCVGAGRGNYSQSDDRGTIYRNWDGGNSTANPSVTSLEQRAMWGMGQEDTGFLVTYPHFCQGISSYSAPQELPASDPTYDNDYFRPRLFRNHLLGNIVGKRRPFQDLTFKKVVCGPFTTHGIIYSVSRVVSFTDIYSNEDKVNVHGRVVSWGRAWPSEACKSNIGPLGVKIFPYVPGEAGSDVERANPSYNPCVNLNGTGNSKYLVGMELPDETIGTETTATPRHFTILNRNLNPNVFQQYEGFIVPNDAYNGPLGSSPIVYYSTKAPVTVSKFKVKDLAVSMDFAGYIGYLNKFQITDRLNYPQEATLWSNAISGATFDYEASLFFVGGNLEWLPHTFNPHSGFYFVKRNKIGSNPTPGNSGSYYADNFEGNTALKVKTRSYYYGAIKPASGATANVGGVSAINYVMPSTLQISSSGAVLTVNADNRPTAWNTMVRTYSPSFDNYDVFETEVKKQRVLDLSLLPSVPFASIKTGKAHVAGVITSDWPIAIGLETTANIPDLCSSLGTLLSTAISGNTYIPGVLADTNKGKQSILWSWGAGDGREYGTGLLSAGPNFNSFLGPLIGGPGLPDFDAGVGGVGFGTNAANAYGMWFMDTHAMTRYDDSLSGTPAGYATPPIAGNGEPAIIARNYKKLSDTAGMSSAVNYYGQYRWLIHSEKNNDYLNDADFQTYTFNGTELIKPDSHLVESLQAKFNFNVFNYPTTVATGLTSSNLLNGTQTALIPVAFGMPWLHGVDLTSIDAKLTKCCTTAADATSVDQQLNHLQEWHGPLSLEIQNEVDYIVDYATGAQTTGVLFVSTADYPQVEAGNHLTNKANYLSYFTNSTNGLLRRFDKRRVCKAAIAGYGCENQTGGSERQLKDGSVAPVIPQLFARTAKIYCGNSYTAVTDPVRVHTFTATAQTLNFTGGATKTFTFNVPSEKYSSRIRGIDVRLTLTCTGASGTDTPVPLNNWVVKIPYKNTEWNVLNNFQRWNGTAATPVTIKGTNLNNSSVLSSTYVFSDRYAPNKAYSYSNEGLSYSEAGLTLANVTVAGTAYSLESAAYSGTELYPILPNATTVNATNYRLGCYAPYSYDATNRATINAWNYADTSIAAQPYLAFDEPTIDLTVTNSGATTNYSNLTLSVELIVEVDAGPYPLAVYGRKRAGIWNNYFGEGPTYQADYFAFDPSNPTSREEVEQACPCLLDPTLNNEFGGRQKPVSFPTDKNFICGTLKYGPSGNPEIVANALTVVWPGSQSNKLLGLVTSNFTSVFSQLLHRPLLDDITAENNLAPVLNSLPAGAFIAISTPVDLGAPPIPITPFKLTIPSAAPTVNIGLNPALINTYRLNTGSADLQRAILGIINFECKLTTNAPALNLDSLNLIHCSP